MPEAEGGQTSLDVAGEAPESERGPSPLRVFTVIVVSLVAFASITGLATGIWFLAGRTGGVGRFVLASAMSILIAWVGIGYFRQLTNPPPPDPVPTAVPESVSLSYICEMCGLELAVVTASKERAPKHCGESMILISGE